MPHAAGWAPRVVPSSGRPGGGEQGEREYRWAGEHAQTVTAGPGAPTPSRRGPDLSQDWTQSFSGR